MIISHKHKFIFIEVGKTGSTSMGVALKKYASPFYLSEKEKDLYNKHIPTVFLKEKLSDEIWETYFKFAFVRNPWDWMISICSYLPEIDFNNKKRITEETILEMYQLDKDKFRAGITWDLDSLQCYKLTDRKGNLLVDFIGKFENLQKDFDKICDKIGIPREKLQHLKKTNHKPSSVYYDNKTKELVYNLCKKDIEYFGYKFEKKDFGFLEKILFIINSILDILKTKFYKNPSKKFKTMAYKTSSKLRRNFKLYSNLIDFIKKKK